MPSTELAGHLWFRQVRFRLAGIYALSVAIVSGAILLGVYHLEAHHASEHICSLSEIISNHDAVVAYHSHVMAQALLATWVALSVLSALVGYFFAPFITRAAEVAMESLSRSADAIAHDLRAPLTRLRVRSEMVASKDGPTAEFAAEVANDTSDLLALVNTLLEIAHLERDGQDGPREDVDLSQVVAETLEFVAPLAEDKGVQLIHSPSPPMRVKGLRVKFQQVVGNLVDNALKHTPSGGWIAVLVELDGSDVRLRVSDNGEGIPKDEQPHLFKKFYRGKSNLHPGNGLGLALVHAIVASYHGKIAVESTPGQGAIFTATFPHAGS